MAETEKYCLNECGFIFSNVIKLCFVGHQTKTQQEQRIA